MQYKPNEVEALITAQRDGEGLLEIEERLGMDWYQQQLRDGKSLEQIKQAVMDEVRDAPK